ncbi:MAG: serine protease [Planctomycetes bacterium]|nr:serine protease [Planctomycetota bacterium]
MPLLLSLLLLIAQGRAEAAAPASRPATLLEQMDAERRALAEKLRPASVVVTVLLKDSSVEFSGVLLDGNGRIAVPSSGVENKDDASIWVRASDGLKYSARYVANFPNAPVAILQLSGDASAFPKAPAIAAPNDTAVGDTVAVIANVLGMDGTTIFGSVSGARRNLKRFPGVELMQTTVDSVNYSGSQGGAVGNRRGEIVGMVLGGSEITDWSLVTVYTVGTPVPAKSAEETVPVNTTQQVTRTEIRALRVPGVSIVLPIGYLTDFVSGNPAVATASRSPLEPRVGFVLNERIDELTRSQLRLPLNQGLVVESVLEGMPAKRAGILMNDIITKICGVAVGTNLQFHTKLLECAGSGKVVIEFIRAGAVREIEVSVETANR